MGGSTVTTGTPASWRTARVVTCSGQKGQWRVGGMGGMVLRRWEIGES